MWDSSSGVPLGSYKGKLGNISSGIGGSVVGIPVINPGFNLRLSCIHFFHYQSLVIASDNMASWVLLH